MYPDFLTCGWCADEFPLSKIIDFIVHKTSCLQAAGGHSVHFGDSSTVLSQQVLSCLICQQDFHTARGILQHIQYSHHMEIVKHKTFSFQQPFVDYSHQVSTAPTVPINPCIAENREGPSIATATSISDSRFTAASHIPDDVSVSSKTAAMPATCAKLASTEGATICCNGKECQVTINPPPQSPPPKKCCSSVIPKKRTRHMQEHDSKDMEQCALEMLTSLRGRLLMSQKSRPSHKKVKKCPKSYRKKKSPCIMSCDRVMCVEKDSEENETDTKEEESVHTCDTVEDDSDGICHGHNSSCKSDPKKGTIEIFSVEKDDIKSRKTVIVNSGVTMTLEPTESASSRKIQDDQATTVTRSSFGILPCGRTPDTPTLSASQEPAQILAELMHHSSPRVEQTVVMPVQGLQASVTDGHIPLTNTNQAEGVFVLNAHCLTEPAKSNLLPVNPGTSTTNAVALSSTLCPVLVSSNPPASVNMPVNIAAPSLPSQVAVGQPLELQQLPDLDALTASIQPVPALEHSSQLNGILSVPEMSVSFGSTGCNQVSSVGSAGDSEDRKMMIQVGKKRRYPTSRPYKCSECDQAFNQPIHLKKHMSKHTGVKPFKCENCEYSTVERSHLKAHNRIHTGEKPFQCQFCSYATAQNSTLKVHLKRHHQDKQTAAMATTPNAGKQELPQHMP